MINDLSDTNSLSKQIPTWVRIYGFGTLILLMAALIGFSFFFEIERVARVRLVSSSSELFIKCDLAEFEPIRNMDTVEVALESGMKFSLILRLQDASYDANNIRIPTIVIKGAMPKSSD
jgi:hypothetical protein